MTLPISITFGNTTPSLPSGMQFVRVLHECELPADRRTNPPRMPEVRPLFPNHFSPFNREWQMRSWKENPTLSAGNMSAVYNTHLWIANNNGTDDSDRPCQDYFLMEHLDSPYSLKVESLTCGGNLLHVLGEIYAKTNSGVELCYIVETLDWHDAPPDVISPWLITTAINLRADGTPGRFPQGAQENGYVPGVRHPFVCNPSMYDSIVIEKWRCVPWTEPDPPDPYKVYLPL